MKLCNTQRPSAANALSAAITACLLMSAPSAFSQSVSATLRGQVTSNSAPTGGATVTATNTDTGLTRTVQSSANGGYSLAGLPPGPYKVDVSANGQTSSQLVTLQVGQTATLDLDTKPKEIASVTVSAARIVTETKTSEVASYVSMKQIEMLPQSSRNFLQFADTIPGVQFIQNSSGSTEIRSGAQSANGVNVFIDGVGQKDYVSRGGISGQGSLSDTSTAASGTRGNPFPQLAIGEYKVITSNYKAEFDQLSSAAIVAATRSGTNQFHAEAFWDRTDEKWRAADPIEASSGTKAASEQEQYGLAVGGPIIQDRMHFFATYEKKNFESPQQVFPDFGIALPAAYAGLVGSFSAPFEEDLAFAKLDWSPGDAHLLWLTVKYRDESEQTFGQHETPSYAVVKDNTEYRYDLRYQYTGSHFLNDAHITYENARFNPRPASSGYGNQLTRGPNDQFVFFYTGAASTYEDRSQKGYGFQDDLTFNAFDWHGSHTIKTGVKYKSIDLDVRSQSPYNALFGFDVQGSLTIPWRVIFGEPLPFADLDVKSSNKQYGLYLQDDWDMTRKLQVNLGLRYDYEETPGYLNYVTPTDILAAFNQQDTNPAAGGHPAAPPGQTYAQTLARGGVDISNYISNGHNRSAFKNGIQPRIGFSYDLKEDQRHVVFGGAGRAYDRNVFEYLARESFKGTYARYTRFFNSPSSPCTPGVAQCLAWDPKYYDPAQLAALVAANPALGREFFMLRNDMRTPYSDQFSLGMRNVVTLGQQDWTTSATISYVKSKDGIVFLLGNRWPDGTFRLPGTTWGGQPWGSGIPGYGAFFLGTNGMQSKAKSLLLSAEKAYTKESGWAVTLAYTFTDAQENRSNIGRTDETYAFDFPNIADYGWYRSTSVPRHRLVATGIYDLPWEISMSAKLTLASPTPFDAVNCLNASDNDHCFFDPGQQDVTFGFRQLDLAAQKEFNVFGDASLRVRFDLLNVFNWANVDRFNSDRGQPGVANPQYLQPQAYLQPTRTFKLSFGVHW